MSQAHQEYLRRRFVTGCEEKRGYKTQALAVRVKEYALRINKGKARTRMEGVVPYRCIFCGMWHLGHP